MSFCVYAGVLMRTWWLRWAVHTCRRALGQQDQARSDYQAVLVLQIGNKEAETGLAGLS